LRLDDLAYRTPRIRSSTKAEAPAIHVHINNPLADSNASNIDLDSVGDKRGIKRRVSQTLSSSDESDSETESLLVISVLDKLDVKYPKLNFPQYATSLAKEGIVYARSVPNFSRDYYRELGMAAGAVGPFLEGIGKALTQEKKARKIARREEKENQPRYQSEEV